MSTSEQILHKEIEQFAKYCENGCSEISECVDAVGAIARTVIPKASAHLFGSQAAGLALRDSDIDIVVLSPELSDVRVDPMCKPTVIKYMTLVAQAIGEDCKRTIQVEQFISQASVPILKCVTRGGIKCDLSFGVEGGMHAAALMKAEVESNPAVRPISLVLKQLLKERDLNEVYRGGISSYGLFHMVLAYFSTVNSTKNKPKSEQKIKLAGGDFPYFTNIADGFMNSKGSECRGKLLEVCLGKCLLEFLEMYGSGFDARNYAVHARRGLVPKTATRLEVDRRDVGKVRLAVVDLMDPTNDVAKGSFNTPLVLNAFAVALTGLHAGLPQFWLG